MRDPAALFLLVRRGIWRYARTENGGRRGAPRFGVRTVQAGCRAGHSQLVEQRTGPAGADYPADAYVWSHELWEHVFPDQSNLSRPLPAGREGRKYQEHLLRGESSRCDVIPMGFAIFSRIRLL